MRARRALGCLELGLLFGAHLRAFFDFLLPARGLYEPLLGVVEALGRLGISLAVILGCLVRHDRRASLWDSGAEQSFHQVQCGRESLRSGCGRRRILTSGDWSERGAP